MYVWGVVHPLSNPPFLSPSIPACFQTLWRRPFWMPSRYLKGRSAASGTDAWPTRMSKSKVSESECNDTVWVHLVETWSMGCGSKAVKPRQCTPVHIPPLHDHFLFNLPLIPKHLSPSVYFLLLPPSHQMTTCFRSQGSTLVSWWHWKWRRKTERGLASGSHCDLN